MRCGPFLLLLVRCARPAMKSKSREDEVRCVVVVIVCILKKKCATRVCQRSVISLVYFVRPNP
jgi:hypothetical protein